MVKYYFTFFIIIFFTACSNRFPDDEIAIQMFKESMGDELVVALDSITKSVDEILVETYQTETPKAAYREFLVYLVTASPGNYSLDLSREKVSEMLELYEFNGYRQEVWNIESVDQIDKLSTNIAGQYFKAMQKIDTLECQTKGYYDARAVSGSPSYKPMSVHIIDEGFDLDNYLVKAMIVSDFFYFVLQNTNSKINVTDE